ncbi:MAG: hypothetical protein M3O68_09955, partial [Thermoproteota archaeon]|nr:hypothetical protein [Thermoproteota archaeon]
MFENTSFAEVIQLLQGIGAIAASVAVGYAIKSYVISREKRQYDLSKNIQDDLLNFNRELSSVDEDDDEAKELLYERLFNSLEWLGFLINEK